MANTTTDIDADEGKRVTELKAAQDKAVRLFEEVEARGLIRAGITEGELNGKIYALAKEMFGVSTYWHKRIVRAGRNTLLPYDENPPDLMIGEDEILFVDLGPVFEDWEADFGRTFVIGNDPLKLKMKRDVEEAFALGKRYFDEHPAVTSRELYLHVESLAAQFGWEWGGPIAGHLIGHFPHERIANDKVSLYVHPGSDLAMRSPHTDGEEAGQARHWILEIHLVDRQRGIGGFFEELLTIG
jgi:Xaa-Pro dipeptidase